MVSGPPLGPVSGLLMMSQDTQLGGDPSRTSTALKPRFLLGLTAVQHLTLKLITQGSSQTPAPGHSPSRETPRPAAHQAAPPAQRLLSRLLSRSGHPLTIANAQACPLSATLSCPPRKSWRWVSLVRMPTVLSGGAGNAGDGDRATAAAAAGLGTFCSLCMLP